MSTATPKVYMKNGLSGAWEQARLHKCTTCGIMFQTAQRTKKYCSVTCHPKKKIRSTDDYVTQHVVWTCTLCQGKTAEIMIVKERRTMNRSEYICDECLRSHPVEVIFGRVSE